jgi:hypothetical protein
MALLDIFGTTPSYYGGLLGEDELNRVRQQAQQQALQNTALALLQAGAPSRTPGNEALAIAQGLAGGQQAYRQSMQEGLQDKMQQMQIQDFMQKQREAQAQKVRQEQMRQMFPQIFTQTVTPEQQTMYGEAARVVRDDEGNLMPGAQITPAQRQISVDPNKLQALAMLSNDPLSTFFNIAEKVPALRKAGFIGGMQQENPFTVFAKDESIPAPLRAVAAQYERSYATGQIDQDTADKRLAELGQRVQSAQQFAQNQAGIEGQRDAVNKLQERMADLREQGLAQSAEARALTASIALGNQQISRMLAEQKIDAAKNKPLPASLQKSEDEDLQAIDSYKATQKELYSPIQALTPDPVTKKSKLELGPVQNLRYQAANLTGNSTEESRAYADLQSAVRNAVNLKVSAEKGVQTDKDVLRFADALISANGKNDTKATLEALNKFNESIATAQKNTAKLIDQRRKSQGVAPLFGDTNRNVNVSY